jgi:hypothetical protein
MGARSPRQTLPTEVVVTTDHDEIQRWAAHRHARPVRSFSTGEVRLDLPADDAPAIERPVDWEEWFRTFDARKLAFLYIVRQADGEVPTHNELVARAA